MRTMARRTVMTRIPLHAAVFVLFAVSHTLLMWGSRQLIYDLFGWGTYNYGAMRYRFVMEGQKQLIIDELSTVKNAGGAGAFGTDQGAGASTYFAIPWRLRCWLPGILSKRSPMFWATRQPRPPTVTPGSRWTACEAWPSPRRR